MGLSGEKRIVAIGLFAAYTAWMPAHATEYYLDCAGADARSGASPEQAWQSLAKAGGATLLPGDKLLLKRGCAWTGPLTLTASGTEGAPIHIGPYGIGADPEIHDGNPANVTIKGDWIAIESLTVRSKPVATDPGCGDQPVGSRSGFTFAAGSSHNSVSHSLSAGHSMGVWLAAGSAHNRVLACVIKDNVSLTVNDQANPDNDAGAFGILVNGDSNEVAYNTLQNNLAWCSYDYGTDGSSVEIYNAKGNRIHHNRSLEEGTFTELGGARTADNVFARNLVVSASEACIFLNVRGPGSKWGPNTGTVAANNTVYLTGTKSQGIVCTGDCAPDILDLRNNIIWSEWKAVYVDGQPREDHNIFWKTGGNPLIQNLTVAVTSKRVDPRFTEASHGDFHPAAGSPALDAGDAEAAGFAGDRDLDGIAVPAGAAADMGAFERPAGAPLIGHAQAGKGEAGISYRIFGAGAGWRFGKARPGIPAADATGARK